MTTEDLPEGSRRERKKAETRARIIECASRLFWERGYEHTSMRDITEAADVASRTFYLHFSSKADVALAQFYDWLGDLEVAILERPDEETPDQMLRQALRVLGGLGYKSGQRLRDAEGVPVPTIGIGLLLAETSADIAGRIYQAVVAFQDRMTREFSRRMGQPTGSLEPRIVAAGLIGAWFVAVNGFPAMVAAGADPPAPDELSTAAFDAYFNGTRTLWQRGRPEPPEHLPR